MEPALALQVGERVSPALIAYAGMLSLSSAGLEQAVTAELGENPALEREDVQRCPVCQSGDPDTCCRRDRDSLSTSGGRAGRDPGPPGGVDGTGGIQDGRGRAAG